jgi:hypothetical protein
MASLSEDSTSTHEDVIVFNQSEERKGLLSGVDTILTGPDEPRLVPWYHGSPLLSSGFSCIMVILATLLGLAFGVSHWLSSPPNSINAYHFNDDTLRSNGTHEFKRTALLVSIDGLRDALSNSLFFLVVANFSYRADYLDRGLTPHLLDISKKGLRAKFMKPVFPVCPALRCRNTWLTRL